MPLGELTGRGFTMTKGSPVLGDPILQSAFDPGLPNLVAWGQTNRPVRTDFFRDRKKKAVLLWRGAPFFPPVEDGSWLKRCSFETCSSNYNFP